MAKKIVKLYDRLALVDSDNLHPNPLFGKVDGVPEFYYHNFIFLEEGNASWFYTAKPKFAIFSGPYKQGQLTEASNEEVYNFVKSNQDFIDTLTRQEQWDLFKINPLFEISDLPKAKNTQAAIVSVFTVGFYLSLIIWIVSLFVV